jgi:glycosyltransferase involved in cell wall biosynthesis
MRILHIFRAPVGGLFRHVRDVVRGQAELGHDVGIICDANTDNALVEGLLDGMKLYCSLGVHRVAMSRMPGLGDISSATSIVKAAKSSRPDIAHGHGAKGGVYVRLAAGRLGAKSVYTPHGGVLHFNWPSPAGLAFLSAEKALLMLTDGLVFVCQYERDLFASKLGLGKAKHTIAHNGLWPEEFQPVPLEADATDILFVGELRALKGVDELLEALASFAGDNAPTATITGSGPDEAAFKAKVQKLGLSNRVRFTGALPTREAFAKGWLMVIPSRAESFPYIVLETVAVGKPLIATNVGGISEVLAVDTLVTPHNAAALAAKIQTALSDRQQANTAAQALASEFKSNMSAVQMTQKITSFYETLL